MPHLPEEFIRHCIAHEHFVVVIGNQCPVIFLWHAEQRNVQFFSLGIVGFKFIRFLRQQLRIIPAHFNPDVVGRACAVDEIGQSLVVTDDGHRGGHFRIIDDWLTAGIKDDDGQVG